MLEQDRRIIAHKLKEQEEQKPVPQTFPNCCAKHGIYISYHVKVYTGMRWTGCPTCGEEERRRITLNMSKPRRNVCGAYHQASLQVRGGK